MTLHRISYVTGDFMADLIEYKCPCCAGKLEFNSGTQNMKCPFCESEFDVDTVQQYNEQLAAASGDNMNYSSSAGGEWTNEEAQGMSVYSCQSCGAKIIADPSTSASSCPYCDAPIVMSGNLSGELKPDLVIPFKLDKKAAKAALSKHLDGKRLLPKVFREENHIDEIKGVYVPVWLFDADADAHMIYKGEKRRTWNDSSYNYTEISYYSAVREGTLAFANVPVDGSSKMADDLMESIEPFDIKDAVEFKTAYLSGYLADRYDVSAEDSIERANQRIKRSTEETFRATVKGYTNVSTESSNVNFQNGKSRYALYPVWLLNTTWNGNKYTFAMNGQTGKFVGNLPADPGMAAKLFIGIAAVSTAVLFGLAKLMGLC